MTSVGIVAIGRNEGERLRCCLEAARAASPNVVYVDSGSDDGSTELARSLGVRVVDLDRSIPFTAARARNEGLAALLEAPSPPEFVQFVDGDCEIVDGWVEAALDQLESQPDVAVACGRRRERHPHESIYNRLCDIEWDTPVGNVKGCGGDAMMRVSAFVEVGGFRPDLIAGEEPELCVRLREKGWRIVRLDAEMTLHDADMHRFGQWWARARRAGHAYVEGRRLHGRAPERHRVVETNRLWFWGLALPLVSLGAAWPSSGWSLCLLLAYPLQFLRTFAHCPRRLPARDAALYALSCVVDKFAQVVGALDYLRGRLLRTPRTLIEYK
jgi:GT2 family glycosyltransferase